MPILAITYLIGGLMMLIGGSFKRHRAKWVDVLFLGGALIMIVSMIAAWILGPSRKMIP